MSAAPTRTRDLDATIARGEWWVRLFGELSHLGLDRCRELSKSMEVASPGMVDRFCRLAHAVRLAVVVAMRLDMILWALSDLRQRGVAGVAAEAEAEIKAKTDDVAAVRETARETARETVWDPVSGPSESPEAEAETEEEETEEEETEEEETDEEEMESLERPEFELGDHDPLVEAMDRRLAAVDPATVDFDDLKLRETVLQICADLGITPDWNRWEAGDWSPPPTSTPVPPPTPNTTVFRASAPPRGPVRSPPLLPDAYKFTPRVADTALSRMFLADQGGPVRRSRLE